jgi:formate hydrogenlyase subunit 3/multisubunit Na+/H+ antiporter MnhD subunit
LADLIFLTAAAWLAGAVLALAGAPRLGRAAVVLGAAAFLALALSALPGGTAAFDLPLGLPGARWQIRLDPAALWLFGFGLVPALLAAWIGTPAKAHRQWTFGLALSLLGALGVFGLQDAMSFLIGWEVMSLGGAVMLLGEGLDRDEGRGTLFMLALLEVGAVALILALILLSDASGGIAFAGFGAQGPLGRAMGWVVAMLLLVGFGAKIGLLPFYEWFPAAYGAGSGATGAVLSGAILNAAFFALARGLLHWLPAEPAVAVSWPAILIVAVAVVTAVLTALYAFQQEDWRRLLCFSSAENGAIAVAMLGAAVLFRQDGLLDLAGLSLAVAYLHLAGHALAKSALFLTADAAYRTGGSYDLAQSGLLRRMPFLLGFGAFLAVMSLAALPPTAGFVSEWFVFQSVFQGFHLSTLAARLDAALAGAGLALTAAIALATFIKVFGLGLLGDGSGQAAVQGERALAVAVGLLGLSVIILAAGMPLWLGTLEPAVLAMIGSDSVVRMHEGWLLVPLTSGFAFISPSEMILVMPLLAILPLLLGLVLRKTRRVPVWFGGHDAVPGQAATTALTFSNALRTFYSFVYRPVEETRREPASAEEGHRYFTRRLVFSHDVAPIFGPYLFAPIERFTRALARRFRHLQSGHLNFYLAVIGVLLVLTLAMVLFV